MDFFGKVLRLGGLITDTSHSGCNTHTDVTSWARGFYKVEQLYVEHVYGIWSVEIYKSTEFNQSKLKRRKHFPPQAQRKGPKNTLICQICSQSSELHGNIHPDLDLIISVCPQGAICCRVGHIGMSYLPGQHD